MDNTELHYLTYDPEAIWDQMIINYVEAGGDILYPGDEKEMLLRSVQADIVQVFAGVDNALRMNTLRYAVGEYLDVLGEQRSCPRIAASAATATVTITTNATGKTDVLEAGTAMTGDGEVFYLLTEDLPLTGYAQTVTVDVVADRTGSAGNGLLADFNPRSPHGERQRKVTILSIRIIGFAQKVYHKTVLLRISLAENAVILPKRPQNPVRTSLQKAGGLRFARAIRAARPYSISSPSGA